MERASYRQASHDAGTSAEPGAPELLEATVSDNVASQQLEELLRSIERVHRYACELNSFVMWAADPHGVVTDTGAAAYGLTDAPLDMHLGDGWSSNVHAEDRALAEQCWSRAVATGTPYEAEFRLRMTAGVYRWVCARAKPYHDDDGRIAGWLGTIEDCHDRKLADMALRESEERYRYTIALSPMIPWIADAKGGIVEVDPRGLELTGLSLEEAQGEGFLAAIHADDRLRLGAFWRSMAHTGAPIDNEVRMKLSDGTYRWFRSRAAARRDADGRIACWYGTIEDIHDRKLAEEAVRWAAGHDGLTGLLNRSAFEAALRNALDEASHRGSMVALLLFDVDKFKLLNDRFGHNAGDRLLADIAARLAEAAGQRTFVGRLGGDEFGMLIEADEGRQLDAEIQRVVISMGEPFSYDGHAHEHRLSIGVAMYPEHAGEIEGLRKHADLALYAAKAAGGGVIRQFEGGMRCEIQTRLSMLSLARDVLDRDAIVPFYQPQFDLRSNEIVGWEALLRWMPGRGLPQPPSMIAAAFDDGELAVAMAEHMWAKGLADMRGWLDHGLRIGRVAFNVSAAEIRSGDFAARVLDRLQQASISPQYIELDISEAVFLGRDPTATDQALATLRGHGITIAFDDFGTGNASLTHLRRFPIHILKIDRSFVHGLIDDRDEAVMRALIWLGRCLGIQTLAEGIETPAQLEWLRRTGCDLGQGVLLGAPMAADEAARLLERVATSAHSRS